VPTPSVSASGDAYGTAPPAGSVAGPARAPIAGGFQRGIVEVVQDDFVVVGILNSGEGKVVLIDAGVAEDAGPIMAALKKRGLGPEAVVAILFTHGDFDHTRGALKFPGAQLMALEADVGLVAGKVSKYPLKPVRETGITVTRALRDGEVVEVGDLKIEVFAVPGHTPGSAVYLVGGVLFLGDSAGASVDGKLLGGDPQHTVDQELNRQSLLGLASKLETRASEIHLMVPSHTKLFEAGLGPLLEYAGVIKK